ncbi:MAG TPA: hypothetical protein VN722_08505 [Hanamia sp.]|nr:hypothetical protein [Hanamia sp.]
MSTSARFTSGTGPIAQGTDNTSRIKNNQYLNPAYAAIINVNPYASETLVNVAALTGALTINTGVGSASTAPYVGDKITFLFTSAGIQVVTFGTGMLSTGTLSTAAGKTANITFIFNGASWCESHRTITA